MSAARDVFDYVSTLANGLKNKLRDGVAVKLHTLLNSMRNSLEFGLGMNTIELSHA
jgi:hypothetical protein